MSSEISIGNRIISSAHMPLVIAEIGINHNGDIQKAIQMVHAAKSAGCECVKFQTHIVDDEMLPNDVIPGNANESIWTMMNRCALSLDEQVQLKVLVESLGMIFMSTPFSRKAADFLNDIDVPAFKIGSGECNHYPLIEHIARFNKPIILSTGMNDISSIRKAVQIIEKNNVPYALMHCTSMYPTPYTCVRLNALHELQGKFPNALIGLSDHSMGNYTCFGAVALGASILEKHFTADKSWPGSDIPISIDTQELADLIKGANAIHAAMPGTKAILKEEDSTIAFAYASIVSIAPINAGEVFSMDNIWAKRPGTGELLADQFNDILGKRAACDINVNQQIKKKDIV